MAYMIEDAHGTELTRGLSEQTARRTAQRMADDRAETVYLMSEDEEDEKVIPVQPREHVSDKRIEALMYEAGAAGDVAQVALCRAALDGDVAAREICERVIREFEEEAAYQTAREQRR